MCEFVSSFFSIGDQLIYFLTEGCLSHTSKRKKELWRIRKEYSGAYAFYLFDRADFLDGFSGNSTQLELAVFNFSLSCLEFVLVSLNLVQNLLQIEFLSLIFFKMSKKPCFLISHFKALFLMSRYSMVLDYIRASINR